jgi:hypothetical protein
MLAIVLSCDRYHAFTRHMIARYEALWSDHPFTFRVPWQQNKPACDRFRIDPVRTGGGIRQTVLTLLEGIDDDTFIYWCIDDKFPVYLDTEAASRVVAAIENQTIASADSLLLHRAGNHYKTSNLTSKHSTPIAGIPSLERSNYKHIWMHQFVRAKVIRHLFASFPEHIPSAKVMDPLKNQMPKPLDHRLYVSASSHCRFQESTSRGKITSDCLRSFQAMQFDVPAWAIPIRRGWLNRR